NSEEYKGGNPYDHAHEDSAPPSSITDIPQTMDSSQENSEYSFSTYLSSQPGADGEDDSSSHHGAEEDHPNQHMDLMGPALEDKHVEDTMLERNLHFPPNFQLRHKQSPSSNSATILKFPLNNNIGGSGNFQEDFEIILFVK
ncbi:hypothetical protein N310_02770, partial [Acanthisitta chloris]